MEGRFRLAGAGAGDAGDRDEDCSTHGETGAATVTPTSHRHLHAVTPPPNSVNVVRMLQPPPAILYMLSAFRNRHPLSCNRHPSPLPVLGSQVPAERQV